MASIPSLRFDITGASGSQGLLSPKEGWRAYILPRGAHASQDSTGERITFDSADAASRFCKNNWVQVGLSVSNIRKITAIGGDSISVSGAVTVAENERVFLIGNTQPIVLDNVATYETPNTIIHKRDDDGSDIYENSVVTSNVTGLIEFFANPDLYDCILQDGKQVNQGGLVNLLVTGDTQLQAGGAMTCIVPTIGIAGLDLIRVRDDDNQQIFEEILTQLKVMNEHLSVVSDRENDELIDQVLEVCDA